MTTDAKRPDVERVLIRTLCKFRRYGIAVSRLVELDISTPVPKPRRIGLGAEVLAAVRASGIEGITGMRVAMALGADRMLVGVTLRRLGHEGKVFGVSACDGDNAPKLWFGTMAEADACARLSPEARRQLAERQGCRAPAMTEADQQAEEARRAERAQRAAERVRQAEARAAAKAQRAREVAAAQLARAKARMRVANVQPAPVRVAVPAPVHIAPRHAPHEVVVPAHVVVQTIPRAPGRYEVDPSEPVEGGGFMAEWRARRSAVSSGPAA